MPIDPRIPLQATFQPLALPDPERMYATLARLDALKEQQQMRQLQEQSLRQDMEERQAIGQIMGGGSYGQTRGATLADIGYTQGPGGGFTPMQAPGAGFAPSPSNASLLPTQGQPLSQAPPQVAPLDRQALTQQLIGRGGARGLAAAKALREDEKLQVETQFKQTEQGLKVNEFMGQVAQGLLEVAVRDPASLPASYMQAKNHVVLTLGDLGERLVAQMPEQTSLTGLQQFLAQTQKHGDTLRGQMENIQMKVAEFSALTPGAAERAGLEAQAEEPSKIRVADVARRGQTEAAAISRAGQVEAAKLMAPIHVQSASDIKRMEGLDKAATAAESMHVVFDEVQQLVKEGVYGNSPADRAKMDILYKTGMVQNDPMGSRTARLRELGSEMILAHGSLGTGVSEYDARTYAKAAGNFQDAKNVQDMQRSIDSMRRIANKALSNANAARTSLAETGRLPLYKTGPETPLGVKGETPTPLPSLNPATMTPADLKKLTPEQIQALRQQMQGQ